MNQDLYALEDLFIRLQGTQIIHYSYGQSVLRLQIKTPLASYLLPGSESIHVVMQGCHQVKYLSYTQTLEDRTAEDDPESIFALGLQIQGMQLSNRETPERLINHNFVIFCNSYLHTIEAGELQITATGFQIYDQEFGQILFEDFKKAAAQLQTNL